MNRRIWRVRPACYGQVAPKNERLKATGSIGYHEILKANLLLVQRFEVCHIPRNSVMSKATLTSKQDHPKWAESCYQKPRNPGLSSPFPAPTWRFHARHARPGPSGPGCEPAPEAAGHADGDLGVRLHLTSKGPVETLLQF